MSDDGIKDDGLDGTYLKGKAGAHSIGQCSSGTGAATACSGEAAPPDGGSHSTDDAIGTARRFCPHRRFLADDAAIRHSSSGGDLSQVFVLERGFTEVTY